MNLSKKCSSKMPKLSVAVLLIVGVATVNAVSMRSASQGIAVIRVVMLMPWESGSVLGEN